MPTYTFHNTETDEVWDEIMRISVMEEFLEQNPHIKQIIGAPAIGDSVRLGLKKPDAGFRDILKNIQKKHDDRGQAVSHTNFNKKRLRTDINTF